MNPLLPLVAALLSWDYSAGSISGVFSGLIGTGLVLVSAVLSLWAAYQYFFVAGKVDGIYRPILALKVAWLQFSPGLSIDMSILLDPISVMMIAIVSFISLMVHIFSLGYMKG